MAEVSDHYSGHLGPVYSWLVGGVDAALARGEAELDSLSIPEGSGSLAVDLGAGFGMHSIPLARRGFSVLAVDNCAVLLRELEAHMGALPIRSVDADLAMFREHVSGNAQIVMCMGDTICHLEDVSVVRKLISEIAAALAPGGTFIVSFRDYTTELKELDRFISVRNDATRILTCFLEYEDTHIRVHDLLHECTPEGWRLAVSSYRKLRLDPGLLIEALEQSRFSVLRQPGLSGMVRIVATRL